MTDKPTPTDAERKAFEVEWHQITGETAITWEAVCVSMAEPVPAHCADHYYSRATHRAWLLWQAARRTPAPVEVEPVASYAIRLLVAAALITQAKADEALRLAAELTAAPWPTDGESNE